MLLVKGTGLGKQGLPRNLVNQLITVARKMRSEQTAAEKRLWHHIRERQLGCYKFRRQGKRAVGFAKIIYDQQPLQLLFSDSRLPRPLLIASHERAPRNDGRAGKPRPYQWPFASTFISLLQFSNTILSLSAKPAYIMANLMALRLFLSLTKARYPYDEI